MNYTSWLGVQRIKRRTGSLPSTRLLTVKLGALGVLSTIATSGYALNMTVDHPVMYVLTGVSPLPAYPSYRLLTFTAIELDQAQRTFLETMGGDASWEPLRVWQKYASVEGGAPTHLYYTHPLQNPKHKTVTDWNKAVAGFRTPTVGMTMQTKSSYEYGGSNRYGVESCVGYAPKDLSSVSTLRVMPGTLCPSTPPSNGPTCSFSKINDVKLGTVGVGEARNKTWTESVTCDKAATVTLGPLTFTGDDSGLITGGVGNTYCNNLGPTYSFNVGAETKNYCLSVTGRYLTPGAKIASGVLQVSYK